MPNVWLKKSNTRKLQSVVDFVQQSGGEWTANYEPANIAVMKFFYRNSNRSNFKLAVTVVKFGADSWDVRIEGKTGHKVEILGKYGLSSFWSKLSAAVKEAVAVLVIKENTKAVTV